MPTNTSTALNIGDEYRIAWTTPSTAGTLTDSDQTLIINSPSGVETNHLATGSYFYKYESTEAGRYTWFARSTGTITSSTYGAWAVKPSAASTS